jgi:hypothetical protein
MLAHLQPMHASTWRVGIFAASLQFYAGYDLCRIFDVGERYGRGPLGSSFL